MGFAAAGVFLLSAGAVPVMAQTSLLDRLSGLTRVSWSDPQTQVGWRYELPAWAWLLILAGALVVAGWSYNRLLGPRAARISLAVTRALLIVVIAALLAGPLLVLPREETEPDWLLVLVDRSASMTLGDVSAGGAGAAMAARRSRDEQLRETLRHSGNVFASDAMTRTRELLWLGFDAATYRIDPPYAQPEALPEPIGQQTFLRTAIEQALQRAAGREISGIVLFSDGRSPQMLGGDIVRRLQQQSVAVFPVPLGAPVPPVDLALDRIDAPDKAMINDIVPVVVWIDQYPRDGAIDPSRVTVRLIDTTTGEPIDEKRATEGGLDPDGPGLRLTGESEVPGAATWRVELVYDPPPGSDTPELIQDNNTRELAIEFIDRPIRVLYVEGYPRWEYRYLKNLLVREQSITSSIMLIEADLEFAQEGDIPLARLPDSAEEFDPFDVIIIGDVPETYWSVTQKGLLTEQVSERGAGMLWIGGAYHMPRSYSPPPLAHLLPMRRPGLVERLNPGLTPAGIELKPTALADQLNVLQLHDPQAAGGRRDDWPAALTPLLWAQDLGPLKPTAEPLANAPVESSEPMPIIVRMRYGAGQSVYVGSDETWRWRYGRGDLYFDQFWIQLVQMLGRSRLQHGDRAWMNLSDRRVGVEQPVVVELTLEDELLRQRDLPRIAVGVFATDAQGAAVQIDRLDLLPVRETAQTLRSGEPQGPRKYTGVWTAKTGGAMTGKITLRVVEPALADLNVEQAIDVIRPDDEMLDPAADHERLALLAEQTGGRIVQPDELDELPALIPNRARKTPADISDPLWNSPLALILIMTLLTAEWIGRKVIRLV